MNEIQRIRHAMSMSQSQFAVLLNVSQQCVNNYEVGKRLPRPRIAKRIIEIAKSNGIDASFERIYETAEAA